MASRYFRENKYFVVISPIPSYHLAKMNILLLTLGRESTCHVSFQCSCRIEYRSIWKPNWAIVWKCSFNKRIAGTSLIAFTVDGCLSLALAYIFSILRFLEMVKQSRDIWCLIADQINLGTVWNYLLHITINILDFPLSLLKQEDKCGILKNKEALLHNLFKSTGNAWMEKMRRGGEEGLMYFAHHRCTLLSIPIIADIGHLVYLLAYFGYFGLLCRELTGLYNTVV